MAEGAGVEAAFLELGGAAEAISERYYYAGRLGEARRILEHALAIAESAGAPVLMRARLLLQDGKLRSLENFQGIGDFDQTLDVLTRALAEATEAGAASLAADAIDLLGMTRYYRTLARRATDYSEALRLFEDALAKRESLGDSRGVAESHFHVGLTHQNSGRWTDARECFERAIERARSGDHQLELSYAVRHLGFVCQHEGDLDGARTLLAQSLALREQIGFRIFLPFSLLALSDVAQAQGDLEEARSLTLRARTIAEAIDSPSQAIFALIGLGDITAELGESEPARELYERALSEARSATFERGLSLAAARLGALVEREQ